jgi:hypothetical protein
MDWRDIERTLALVNRTTITGSRDYAILVLLAYCGLRAGEAPGHPEVKTMSRVILAEIGTDMTRFPSSGHLIPGLNARRAFPTVRPHPG